MYNYSKAVKLAYLSLIRCRRELADLCILRFHCSDTDALPGNKEAWHLEDRAVWQTRLIMNEPTLYNQEGEKCYKLEISMFFITGGNRMLLRVSLMLKLAVGCRDHLLPLTISYFPLESLFLKGFAKWEILEIQTWGIHLRHMRMTNYYLPRVYR